MGGVAGENSHINEGFSSKSLKRTSKRYHDPALWDEIVISRHITCLAQYSDRNLKSSRCELVVNCMKLNTLRGTKTGFLTSERHYEHRGLFLYGCPPWELSFHNDTTTNTNQNGRLDVQDTTETTISMWACAEWIITLLSVLYHSDSGRVDNVYTQFRLQQHVRTW